MKTDSERGRNAIAFYSGEGSFAPKNEWKLESDQAFGSEMAVAVWQGLRRRGILPAENKPIIAIFAASNKPTQEAAIFLDEMKRRVSMRFLVGDFAEPQAIGVEEVLQGIRSVGQVEQTFEFFRWDATRLPVKSGIANVIWDRKGGLWHTSYFPEQKLVDAFEQYYSVLVPGGSLVIDAIDGYLQNVTPPYLKPGGFVDENLVDPTIADELSRFDISEFRPTISEDDSVFKPSSIYPNLIGQFEPSTVQMITYHHGSSFWDRLSKLFTIQDIGSGRLRVRVLTKHPTK